MGLMGLCGLAGNIVLSRHVGTLGADRGARWALSVVWVGLALWTATQSLAPNVPLVLPIGAIIVWGLGNFAFTSSQQARLAQTAPHWASASIALNSSSLYAGQALGAVLGAALVATLGTDALGPVALVIMGAAWASSWWADRAKTAGAP
jgi:predicted MFS family arabinose efflux permease